MPKLIGPVKAAPHADETARALTSDLENGLHEAVDIQWFDEKSQEKMLAYIAGDRVVALAPDKPPQRSIYGSHLDEGRVVTRSLKDESKEAARAFVTPGGATKPSGANSLSQALARLGPGTIRSQSLAVDTGAILGAPVGSEELLHQTSATGWKCAITGDLTGLPRLPDIRLIPDIAAWNEGSPDERYLVLTEGEFPPDTGGNRLWISLTPEKDRNSVWRPDDISLVTPVEPLLDDESDGGWERGAPIWLMEQGGYLRIGNQGDGATLPYRLLEETRPTELGELFAGVAMSPVGGAPLPAGTRVRLLLDRSGPKRLTIRFGKGAAAAPELMTLEIASPALSVSIPHQAVNGKSLPNPMLPPPASPGISPSTLYLVSPSLTRTVAEQQELPHWTLLFSRKDKPAADKGAPAMQLRIPKIRRAITRFTTAGNWVRPPESAANGERGLSELRILMPHTSSEIISLTVGGRGFSLNSPDERFVLDYVEAAGLGPIAHLAPAGSSAESYLMEADGASGVKFKAPKSGSDAIAVFRPDYRVTPGGKSGEMLSAYDLTHTLDLGDMEATAGIRCELADLLGLSYAGRHDPASKAVRSELRMDSLSSEGRKDLWGGRLAYAVGWSDAYWLKRQTFALGVHAALEWGEIWAPAKNTWNGRPWFRLPDDSLWPGKEIQGKAEISHTAVIDAMESDPAGPREPGGVALPVRIESPLRRNESDKSGLALFEIVEELPSSSISDSSRFTLLLQGQAVVLDAAHGSLIHGPDRVVIALAGQVPAEGLGPDSSIGFGTVVSRLTRLFLELERRDGRFQVKCAMLGWSATKAFGMAPADGDRLQVTELFERREAELVRTLEYNGVVTTGTASGPGWNWHARLCFWDTVVREPGGLPADSAQMIRVVCHHFFLQPPENRPRFDLTSIQDARIIGDPAGQPGPTGLLDLSADIAILPSGADGLDGAEGRDRWQPDRRSLFRLEVDARSDGYEAIGFLTLRRTANGEGTLGVAEQVLGNMPVTLIPDWAPVTRDVLPQISAESRASRPGHVGWLADAGLRSEPAQADDGTGLIVTLSTRDPIHTINMNPKQACTLSDRKGIPQWVPSPVRVVKTGDALAGSQSFCRVWIFDPTPRCVVEWPMRSLSDLGDAPSPERREAALKQFQAALDAAPGRCHRILSTSGWTREAVLELPDFEPEREPQWKVVDSPLLNRGLSGSWFGWPERAAVLPMDPLPLTEQVVQAADPGSQSFAVQVPFQTDRLTHDGADRLWQPKVYTDPGCPDIRVALKDMAHDARAVAKSRGGDRRLSFHPGRLRAGAWYEVLAYGARSGLPADARVTAFRPPGRWKMPNAPRRVGRTVLLSDAGTEGTAWPDSSLRMDCEGSVELNGGGFGATLRFAPAPAVLQTVRAENVPAGTTVQGQGDLAARPLRAGEITAASGDLRIVFPQAPDRAFRATLSGTDGAGNAVADVVVRISPFVPIRVRWMQSDLPVDPAVARIVADPSAPPGQVRIAFNLPPGTTVNTLLIAGAPAEAVFEYNNTSRPVSGDVIQLNPALTADPAHGLVLLCPAGSAFTDLQFVLNPATDTARVWRVFSPNGSRFAGMFDGRGLLVGAGEEVLRVYPPADAQSPWRCEAGAPIPARAGDALKLSVVVVDQDGNIDEFKAS